MRLRILVAAVAELAPLHRSIAISVCFLLLSILSAPASTGQPLTNSSEESVKLIVQKGHTEAVYAVAYSSNGEFVATGGDPHVIIIWDARTGYELERLQDAGQSSIIAIRFSSDGKQLYSLDSLGSIQLWSIADGGLIRTIDTEPNSSMGTINCIALNEDTQLFLGTDKGAQLLDLNADKVIRRYPKIGGLGLKYLEVSADGRLLLGGDGFTVWIWDTARGGPGRPIQLPAVNSGRSDLVSATLGPNAKTLLVANILRTEVGSAAGIAKLLELREDTGAVMRTLWTSQANVLEVDNVLFSPRSRLVVFGINDFPNSRFEVLQYEDEKKVTEVPQSVTEFASALSPDGSRLAFLSDQPTVWDLKGDGRAVVLSSYAESMQAVTASSDGLYLAVASRQETRLWNLQTGKNLTLLLSVSSSVHDLRTRQVACQNTLSRRDSAFAAGHYASGRLG